MPKTQTNALIKARAKRSRKTTVDSPAKRDRQIAHAYLYQDDQPTHVLVPIEEYEHLMKADMARTAVAKLDQRDPQWVDADVLALRLAGERIVAARKAAGLTQKQLGQKLKLPQSQISRLERHPDRTTVRTLKRIAKALGVDVSALI
ncbi:MAG: helix-turn-helix transcriptional regulator [Phycisphaerae bacterium]|nr:helix-turn-helix transcriptional regulator [Phycisphaerae bacterium]